MFICIQSVFLTSNLINDGLHYLVSIGLKAVPTFFNLPVIFLDGYNLDINISFSWNIYLKMIWAVFNCKTFDLCLSSLFVMGFWQTVLFINMFWNYDLYAANAYKTDKP